MKLDLNLLKRLLVIDHPSKHEWPMLSAIINECYKIGNLYFEMDGYCNIFITKNTSNPDFYPCVVAHTDCVIPCEHKKIKMKGNKIVGIDGKTNKRTALGADDTNGICCALQLLKALPDLKVCFTTEEEIGFLGAEYAADNIDFFYNVSYMIQADRRGNKDLITHTNGIHSASEAWLQEVSGIMAKYHYSEQYGIGTDIGVLAEKLQISGVNISCGYSSEHTVNESINVADLQNCLNFMLEIIKTVPLDKQYEIKIEYKPYTRYYDEYYKHYYDDYEPKALGYDDFPKDDEHLACEHCSTYDCMNCKIYPDYY